MNYPLYEVSQRLDGIMVKDLSSSSSKIDENPTQVMSLQMFAIPKNKCATCACKTSPEEWIGRNYSGFNEWVLDFGDSKKESVRKLVIDGKGV